MICLGIESTAHTFACGIVNEEGGIFSDVRDVYKTEKGGIIPSDAALHHKNIYSKIIQNTIEQSKAKNINLVAFSQGPGLAPCLKIGLHAAKEIAQDLKVPLIGVNHLVAHIEIGKLLCKAKDPVCILATGANTIITALEGKKYRIFGETLDIGIGNALDKFGRDIGLGFPCGPKIEELARKGKYVELPYSVKGIDLSFSGIITDAINKFKKGYSKEDLCFSLQETCFAMLTEVTERAVAHLNKNEVLLIGGVAANKRLCEMLEIMCKERGIKFSAVPLKYSGDNAVMIAWLGILMYNAKVKQKIDIVPYERLDQVDVSW